MIAHTGEQTTREQESQHKIADQKEGPAKEFDLRSALALVEEHSLYSAPSSCRISPVWLNRGLSHREWHFAGLLFSRCPVEFPGSPLVTTVQAEVVAHWTTATTDLIREAARTD